RRRSYRLQQSCGECKVGLSDFEIADREDYDGGQAGSLRHGGHQLGSGLETKVDSAIEPRHFEIGRVLHLKSEIRNIGLDLLRQTTNLPFRISDLKCRTVQFQNLRSD